MPQWRKAVQEYPVTLTKVSVLTVVGLVVVVESSTTVM
jgi:hypothetical protein